jgi:hypothetical protein
VSPWKHPTRDAIANKLTPSTYQTEATRTELLLGGGPPIIIATIGAIPRIGASLEATLTIGKRRPNRAIVVRSPSTVSIVVGEQNGALMTPRPRWKKPHCFWCPLPQVRVLPCASHGATPLGLCFSLTQ